MTEISDGKLANGGSDIIAFLIQELGAERSEAGEPLGAYCIKNEMFGGDSIFIDLESGVLHFGYGHIHYNMLGPDAGTHVDVICKYVREIKSGNLVSYMANRWLFPSGGFVSETKAAEMKKKKGKYSFIAWSDKKEPEIEN